MFLSSTPLLCHRRKILHAFPKVFSSLPPGEGTARPHLRPLLLPLEKGLMPHMLWASSALLQGGFSPHLFLACSESSAPLVPKPIPAAAELFSIHRPWGFSEQPRTSVFLCWHFSGSCCFSTSALFLISAVNNFSLLPQGLLALPTCSYLQEPCVMLRYNKTITRVCGGT